MAAIEYTPLDLSSLCTAGLDGIPEREVPPIGPHTFHGLPFHVGAKDSTGKPCFVKLSVGDPALSIEIGDRTAHHLIFAHRQLESRLMQGGPLGEVVAHYTIHYGDGTSESAAIRERFEICALPVAWGQLPFLAVPDQPDRVMPRFEGPWGAAGERLTEVDQQYPQAFVLWAWANPHPDRPITSVEIAPAGPTFLIAAITLGHLDEEPFCRSAPRTVKVSLGGPAAEASMRPPTDLRVDVDRGLATYPYPLPTAPLNAFLADGMAGYGEPENQNNSPCYIEVAANPSATLSLRSGKEELGQITWRDLVAEGVVSPATGVQVQVIDSECNWVRTTVLDDGSGEPIPCRVHFRSPDGVPYAPHGHHAHLNGQLDTWHVDVGGDVRLGQCTYAYIDGTCEGWLPRGEVAVDVARGFEYEPLRTVVRIEPGQQNLTLRLKRWCDMNARRYFSGDTHVHFLSSQGAQTEARAEDLNVVNLLLSQWGSLFTNTEEFTGGPLTSTDRRTIVYASQENRQHMLGHLSLLGLKRQVAPWCSDGPSEAELGSTLETTLSQWADACHAQGGTVIIPHLPSPNGEPAALIATGRADAVEMINFSMYAHNEYYRYLNCGYRLPLVGGTDKMSSEVPVGLYRTYVRIPDDEEFTYESWCRNLRAGRTFQSGGPMINLTVDGHQVGDIVSLPGNGGTVEVEAWAESILPLHRLEIVQQGQVIASTEESKGARRLLLRATVPVTGHTWLAARAGGPGYTNAVTHHDVWRRGIMAHTSPVYLAVGGEWWLHDADTAAYMLTLMEGSLAYIRTRSRQARPGTVTHFHGEADHQAFLERPFQEAIQAIHAGIHRAGIVH
jgi:hypothetical protein